MSGANEEMSESKRSGRLMALRSKFKDLTLALKTKTLPKRSRKISDKTDPLESLYFRFVFKVNALVLMMVVSVFLGLTFVICIISTSFTQSTLWALLGIFGASMIGVSWDELIEPKVHLAFLKRQRKLVKERFTENSSEIHLLEEQLLIVSKEYDKTADSDDAPLPLDDLYNWYASAGLPLSSSMKDLFAEKIKEKQEQNNLSRARNESYKNEASRIARLLEMYKSKRTPLDSILKNFHPGELLSEDRRDPSSGLHPLEERIYKIGDALESIDPGSGKNFVSEISVPFDSLCRLSDLSRTSTGNTAVTRAFHESMEVFKKRLAKEESRISKMEATRAEQEQVVIRSLLA